MDSPSARPDDDGMDRRARSDRRRALPAGLVALWAAAIIGGFIWLGSYAATPGQAHAAPEALPAVITPAGATATRTKPIVMMFVHPACPCTPASLDELAGAVGDHGADVSLIIAGPAAEAVQTHRAILATADRFGWDVLTDPAGTLAHRFGAHTSGHTVCYDAAGALAFSGGVTATRGHRGPNAGAAAVAAALAGATPDTDTAPVYGCPIFDPVSAGPGADDPAGSCCAAEPPPDDTP